MWKVIHDGGAIGVTDGRLLLGRNNFPNDLALSRRHVEITVQGKKVFIRDLGSTNGTIVGNDRIPAQTLREVKFEDVIKIGHTSFILRHDVEPTVPEPHVTGEVQTSWKYPTSRREPRNSAGFLARCVFAILVVSAILDPTFALGRSVGLFFVLLVALSLAASTTVAALIWSWILNPPEFSLARSGAFVSLVLVSAVALYSLTLHALDTRFPLSRGMAMAKIRYFCVEHLDSAACAQQTAICRSCLAADKRNELRTPAGSQPR